MREFLGDISTEVCPSLSESSAQQNRYDVRLESELLYPRRGTGSDIIYTGRICVYTVPYFGSGCVQHTERVVLYA
jgi:hypothetical protein